MNTTEKDGEATKPMSVEEMLADIRKRLGRIERDLIIMVQTGPQRTKLLSKQS